jgi:hypothetical protein
MVRKPFNGLVVDYAVWAFSYMDGRLNIFRANFPKASASSIPTTGTMMVSGGHKPTVSMGKKADNSTMLLEAI